jgi:hypothetical protein
MRPRRLFLGAILAAVFAVLVPGAVSATNDPYITLTPPSGPAGSQVSVNTFNFVPNTGVIVILRITGDPVVATGKADHEGRANVLFTIPANLAKGIYNVHVTDQDGGCDSGGRFTVTDPTPTPTPKTPTATPTPVVTTTPTPPPPTATTPRPTTPPSTPPPPPRPPIAGAGIEGGGTAGPGSTLALLTIVLAIFALGSAMALTSRRGRGPAAPGRPQPAIAPVVAEPEVAPAIVERAEPIEARSRRAPAAEMSLFAVGIAAAVAGVILLVSGKRRD